MKQTLNSRINALHNLFGKLEITPGRLDKESLVERFKKENSDAVDDLNYCFEVMTGRHKLGYTLVINDDITNVVEGVDLTNKAAQFAASDMSLEMFCSSLFEVSDHTESTLIDIATYYLGFGWFLMPLFNREWRTGISKSLLEVSDTSPMLAKKFDPNKIPVDDTYYLTEKLDGNRCIARYSIEKGKWEFISRSGKMLKAVFDMTGLPTDYIYDGEILSLDQIEKPSQENFNALSGQLNSKYGDKSRLIYMIFDIICNMPYKERSLVIRAICVQKLNSNNVRILPVLCSCGKDILIEVVDHYLDEITSRGGEGVMINLGSATYQHKRTDKLLKVKNVYTMDMRVVSILQGSGKYSGQVGSLVCCAVDPTDKVTEYVCQVGSGINDYQRYVWFTHPEDIIGKIVEVAYFSLSQDNNNRGTPTYSLRFPRLKRVRHDKTETSID